MVNAVHVILLGSISSTVFIYKMSIGIEVGSLFYIKSGNNSTVHALWLVVYLSLNYCVILYILCLHLYYRCCDFFACIFLYTVVITVHVLWLVLYLSLSSISPANKYLPSPPPPPAPHHLTIDWVNTASGPSL